MVRPLLERTGLPQSPETLIRAAGGVQLCCGLLFSVGRARRLSALALAVTTGASAYAYHRFWQESDEALRGMKRVAFAQDLGLVGASLLALADTEGAPSLGWRARRAARQAGAAARGQRRRRSRSRAGAGEATEQVRTARAHRKGQATAASRRARAGGRRQRARRPRSFRGARGRAEGRGGRHGPARLGGPGRGGHQGGRGRRPRRPGGEARSLRASEGPPHALVAGLEPVGTVEAMRLGPRLVGRQLEPVAAEGRGALGRRLDEEAPDAL